MSRLKRLVVVALCLSWGAYVYGQEPQQSSVTTPTQQQTAQPAVVTEPPQAAPPAAAVPPPEAFRVVSPAENTVVVGKRPLLSVEFITEIAPGSLLVMLDGTDVTQMLTTTPKGFEYRPVANLTPGQHTMNITAKTPAGIQVEKTASFSLRHTAAFEEATMDNEAFLQYEKVLVKPASDPSPYTKAEGNIRSTSNLRNGPWQFGFTTNIRYFDQSLPVMDPLKKGFDGMNWTLSGTYTKDLLKFSASVGDVQVNETPYTLMGIARKGGVFALDYDIYQVKLFTLKAIQVIGFRGGTGMDTDTDDHILGTSAGVKLFNRKAEVRAIYITGGDPGLGLVPPPPSSTSYIDPETGLEVVIPATPPVGISFFGGPQKGTVGGVIATTNFFENKFQTEFEAYASRFDPETRDEFGEKSDKAIRLHAFGNIGVYNYDAVAEYVGRDYAVVGNQGLPKDKEGVAFRNGIALDGHGLNVTLSRYNDNVRGDVLFPRVVSYQGMVDYSLNKFPTVPMGLSFSRASQESTRIPEGGFPMEMVTDTLSGRIGYMAGNLNVNLQTTYSVMDDRTEANNDTVLTSVALMPSYNTPQFSVTPNFQFNRSTSRATDIYTDTYTAVMDVRSKWLQDMLSADASATYSINKTNNGSMNMHNLMANFRLAYDLTRFTKDFMRPNIALRGTYMKTIDKISHQSDRDAFALFLVLSTSVPFVF